MNVIIVQHVIINLSIFAYALLASFNGKFSENS